MKAGAGNFFEDFRVGQELRHATPRTVSAGDAALYIGLTGSRFALHSSDEFARALGLRAAPIDDLLVFHIVFGKTVPDISLNAVANLGYAECRFGVPVYAGVNSMQVEEIVSLARVAAELGYQAIMLAAPPYALPSGPELPLSRSPESISQPRFQRWAHKLDAERWQKLVLRAATAGVTPSVAVLAAFTGVLTTWSRHPHYAVMLTLFNRRGDHPDLYRIVGDFTSVTPLEIDHRQQASFSTHARAIQGRMWTDLDHRAVGGIRAAGMGTLARRAAGLARTCRVHQQHRIAGGSGRY